jgi:hypothetical protein
MTEDKDINSLTSGAQPELMPARETQAAQGRPASLSSVSQNRVAGASPAGGSPYSVELHIEELVLHGFAESERYRIGEAIERELTRLFIEQGTPSAIAQGADIAQLDGGAIEVKPGSDAETTGVQLAQALYGGLV